MHDLLKIKLSISDYITTQHYDIMCITETWICTDIDAACIGEMVPNGYDFHHVPRSNGRNGGGVGIVYKTELSLKVTSSSASDADTSQFEYIDCCTDNNCAKLRFVVVYRPPTSARNGLETSTFSMNGHISLSTCQSTTTTLSSLAT